MGRLQNRIARIREEIPIVSVLLTYGYRVREDGGDREQQFPCDLHGDGADMSPSARAYDDHWYCFGCGTSRDAIDTVMAKEQVSLGQAIRMLEQNHGLPAMPWGDEEDDEIDFDKPRKPSTSVKAQVEEALTKKVSFEDWVKRIEAMLMPLTQERTLGLKVAMKFWEMFDKVCHRVREEELSEPLGSQALERLRGQIMDEMKGGSHAAS